MATTYEQLAPGYEFPSARYELTASLISKYLKAVDNPDELRVFGGIVPPLAMAAYAMAEMSRYLSLPPGSIHASQEFEFFKLVPVGAVVDCQAKVVKKLTRGTLRMLVLGIDVFDQRKQKVQSGKATVVLPA
jgi:acyl dehydratase